LSDATDNETSLRNTNGSSANGAEMRRSAPSPVAPLGAKERVRGGVERRLEADPGVLRELHEERFPAWDATRGAPTGIVILGGATRGILATMTVPTLMSH
jgi:hypothetical protein